MKKIYIAIGAVLVLALLYYAIFGSAKSSGEQTKDLVVKPTRGDLEIAVKATGEIRSENSVDVNAPGSMREINIWQTTITRLIPEGTQVKKGQWVVSLDKTAIETKINEINAELEKIGTQLEQAVIDTAIEMGGIRDQMVNMKYSIKEKRLVVEQSKYEPQMIIRQAELDMERILRDFKQLEKKYELKQRQARAKVSEILADRNVQYNKRSKMNKVGKEFDISAPEDGMFIYKRDWRGNKRGVGSEVSGWNSQVGELPDLSSMLSRTYINEVDISRVLPGQEVEVTIDAFPDKQFTGIVTEVANVGQQLKNQDTKVFEVMVKINEQDSVMRPAMTSANKIVARNFINVLTIPLEAIHKDSIEYVLKKSKAGMVQQEILVGAKNDDFAVINLGLDEDDEFYLAHNEIEENVERIFLDANEKELALDQIKEDNDLHRQELAKKIVPKIAQHKKKGTGGRTIIRFQ